jgi:large subunit ribosomal protein L15
LRVKLTEITLDDYKKLGLASSKKALIKILGSGELTSALTIHAHKFSKSAVEKIEKAGGKAVVLGGELLKRRRTKLVAKAKIARGI